MDTTAHPSFLELDRLALGAGSDVARRHAEGCASCAGHLARVGTELSLPPWVQQWAPEPRAAWVLRWTLPRLALAGACTAIVVAGLVYGRSADRGRARVDAFQEKGGVPALAVYIKRADRVDAWDGREAVQPGDSLRLQIAPEGFEHVTVDSPAQPGAHLYDGALPAAVDFLPVSWRVDGQPGPEVLDVTLSGPGLPPWHARLVLPKSTFR